MYALLFASLNPKGLIFPGVLGLIWLLLVKFINNGVLDSLITQ